MNNQPPPSGVPPYLRLLKSLFPFRNNVYTDTTLLTCAEYQLFLDDQASQGHHYHPWHWTSNTFQPGQGDQPILGIQPSDTQALCQWLNTRENGLWHYRLPHKDELSQILAHLKKDKLPPDAIGFWADGNEFAWLNNEPPKYANLAEMVLDQLLLDRSRALAYDRVRARDIKDEINEMLELEQELNNQQVPDITPLLVQNISIQPLNLINLDTTTFPDSDLPRYFNALKNEKSLASVDLKISQHSSPAREAKKHLYWLIRYWCQPILLLST